MNTENDYEALIDAWIARAIRYYGNSDTALKKYCILASPIVGKYQNGGTQAIADGIQRHVSTVENHAHAHWLYVELRNSPFRSRIRTLWRSLPASHWWQAWGIQKAGFDALYYLENAAHHRWSGRVMMEEYKRDREGGHAPMIFKRGVIALCGLADELLGKHNNQLNEGQRIALLVVQEAFTGELEEIARAEAVK